MPLLYSVGNPIHPREAGRNPGKLRLVLKTVVDFLLHRRQQLSQGMQTTAPGPAQLSKVGFESLKYFVRCLAVIQRIGQLEV